MAVFQEPLDDVREQVYKNLETFIWGHLYSFVDDRKSFSDPSTAMAHLVLAYNPDFLKQLIACSGVAAPEIQGLIDRTVVKFVECLLLSLQYALINEPLRIESLVELAEGLEETRGFIYEGEVGSRFAAKAEKGEQDLPQFLTTNVHYLEALFLDALAKIVVDSQVLSDETIEELTQDCIPEEAEKFKAAMAKVNAYAATFLSEGVTGDSLSDILLAYLEEKILKTGSL